MRTNIQDLLKQIIKSSLSDLKLDKVFKEDLYLDLPKDNRFGDLSTNLALKLSRLLKQSPHEVATKIITHTKKYLEKSSLKDYVKEVKVEGVGFINFYLTESFFYEQLKTFLLEGENSIKMNFGKGRRVLIEFVSANPTGPLSIAHARLAVAGDVLANILDFLGFNVRREYYLNDEGKQIDILGESVELRLKELAGQTIEFPPDYYQGEYIYDIARKICATNIGASAKFATKSGESAKHYGGNFGGKNEKFPAKAGSRKMREKVKNFSDFAVKYILRIIKKDLDDFGIKFDYWYSQKKLRKTGKIKRTLDLLKRRGFLYEQGGALWFKSSRFGDDKDRVVVKSDGTYTYLAPDIAYHKDKFKRRFSWLINLWGPDHHGYINRIKAAVKALGKSEDSLSIIIVQLASILKGGKPLQMSTRKAQFITLREVLDEVGPDVARFFFLMRRTSSHLDFDLDIAKKQTPENPVYYVQYAHARICSILRNSPVKIKYKDIDLTVLKEKEEIDLIKKLWQFSYILNICLNALDPYMLTMYLGELAEKFHKFYDIHRVLGQDKMKTLARLALIQATKTNISCGLKLLGISRPEKM